MDGANSGTEAAPGVGTGNNSQFPELPSKKKSATWADMKEKKFTLVNLKVEVETGKKPFKTIQEGLKVVLEAASSAQDEVVLVKLIRR